MPNRCPMALLWPCRGFAA